MNDEGFDKYTDIEHLRGGVTYLATPYSSEDDGLMERRWRRVTAFAAKLESAGCTVISPVTQNREIADIGDMPESWGVWKHSCLRLLERSDFMLVLECREHLGSTWRSVGVQSEIEHARKSCIPA